MTKPTRPRRILHVLYSARIAGAEEYVRMITAALDPAKFESTVCFMHTHDTMVDTMRNAGVPVRVIGMKNGLDLVRSLRFLSFVLREKFDLIHIHMPNVLAVTFSLMACKTVILHEHTIGAHAKRRKLLLPLLFKKIKKFVAVSHNTKNNLLRLQSIPERKLTVIHNGIEISRFQVSFDKEEFRRQHGISPNTFIIGFVARLEDEKGCDLLLTALAKVKEKINRDFHLLLFGQGSKEKEWKELTAELGLHENVTFMGVLPDITRYFNIFDLFVLPSRLEPFGLVILEAMACSVPSIAFEVGGIPEFLRHEQDGYLIPPFDTDIMADRIISLINSNILRNSLGTNARKRVEDFSIRKTVRQLESLYSELLEAKHN
ncbi:MAG: glycosyltransferase family 1 protein [Candidatus Auribacter fodinae]|jgi:glycosyltransferase involved in cell wall biosynthesis|uniref:Glycosyltransferase family 1 protein n=1 Tax=Candidatus Auribacter fodinae TaxID=2093366 RepID=A0A3A4QVV0_9BACT|nr:MAG: glycosyltransferase family 1 protein [Candidatus Auribacter fodinae]